MSVAPESGGHVYTQVMGAAEMWDRRISESRHAYAAFCVYRDLGPRRTVPWAAREYYCGPDAPNDAKVSAGRIRTMERWSSDNHWPERAEAWDDYLDQQKRLILVEEVALMRERHTEVAQQAVHKAALYVDSINVEKLTVPEAVKLLELGAKLERLSRGEPDSIRERRGPDAPEQATAVALAEEIRDLLAADPELASIADEFSEHQQKIAKARRARDAPDA